MTSSEAALIVIISFMMKENSGSSRKPRMLIDPRKGRGLCSTSLVNGCDLWASSSKAPYVGGGLFPEDYFITCH